MCLAIDVHKTNSFLSTCPEVVTVYKCVLKIKNESNNEEFFMSPYYTYIWNPGIHDLKDHVISDNIYLEDGDGFAFVNNAFHAFYKPNSPFYVTHNMAAIVHRMRSYYEYIGNYVFELEVKKNDIIALGNQDDIAFKRCFLTQVNHDNAICIFRN